MTHTLLTHCPVVSAVDIAVDNIPRTLNAYGGLL